MNDTSTEPLRIRFQIRFAKTDLLRWISHRDLARLWERLLRRSRLELSLTEGFHPKPRIGFPSALALGIEGHDEVVEIDLAEAISAAELLDRLAADDQPGLRILSVAQVPEGLPKARLKRSHYSVPIPEGFPRADVEAAIAKMRQVQTLSVTRKNKTITIDAASQIDELNIDDAQLKMVMSASDKADLKPTDVLSAMGLNSLLEAGAYIVRTRVELEHTLGPEHCVQLGMTHEKRDVDQCRPTGRESHCDS
ncbi:TIGR03936 family radical SAM-associated protein [Roseimaritima sediminicola]|uniref:TIGR03936 family radical SAM-associated protein n=1 Tax=Roseimaritima sediminicola TaxID=2662066 RepID=UPI0012983E70|nr:TIGR03936 family radical SAM-associated protein [Roseimaritima sediminicola]